MISAPSAMAQPKRLTPRRLGCRRVRVRVPGARFNLDLIGSELTGTADLVSIARSSHANAQCCCHSP